PCVKSFLIFIYEPGTETVWMAARMPARNRQRREFRGEKENVRGMPNLPRASISAPGPRERGGDGVRHGSVREFWPYRRFCGIGSHRNGTVGSGRDESR